MDGGVGGSIVSWGSQHSTDSFSGSECRSVSFHSLDSAQPVPLRNLLSPFPFPWSSTPRGLPPPSQPRSPSARSVVPHDTNEITRSQRRRRWLFSSPFLLMPELHHNQGAAWRSVVSHSKSWNIYTFKSKRSDLRGSVRHQLGFGELKHLFEAWEAFPIQTHFTVTFSGCKCRIQR